MNAIDKYPDFVRSRAKDMGAPLTNLLHGAVGISGEAGELLDCVKKSWVYNRPLDYANLAEEAGDILFYLQVLCNETGWTIEQLIQSNMDKLVERYPTGYSDTAAQARADKQPKLQIVRVLA